MNSSSKQTLILSLIKDDLRNTCLVEGLNNLGIQADHYFLHLSENIFELLGFEDNEASEAIYMHYLELKKKIKTIEFSNSEEQLKLLALDIYNVLIKMKEEG